LVARSHGKVLVEVGSAGGAVSAVEALIAAMATSAAKVAGAIQEECGVAGVASGVIWGVASRAASEMAGLVAGTVGGVYVPVGRAVHANGGVGAVVTASIAVTAETGAVQEE